MVNSITNWIEQWLTDRKQRVVVDGDVSSWKTVLSGVPQGSVLGPMLFLIYNNYLEEVITSKLLKENDLGLTVNANMKVSEQCRIAASQGNEMIGMIRRNIT